jgi:hypothetical protein
VCITYHLGELADDPAFATWIAETIPCVIQPGTWHAEGKSSAEKGTIRHFAPAKILVVSHTQAVHAQVDAFLKDIKKSLPHVGQRQKAHGIMPAQFLSNAATSADSSRSADTAKSSKTTYPVPAPLQQPKHLFHLVLRYEGEGIVDAQVVEVLKGLTGQAGVSEAASNKTTKEETAKAEGAKPMQTNQLFNFVLRYEGEGIIDSNVVEFFKAYLKEVAKNQGPSSAGLALPGGTYLNAAPAYAPGPNSPVADYPTPSAYRPLASPGTTSPMPTTAPRAPSTGAAPPTTTAPLPMPLPNPAPATKTAPAPKTPTAKSAPAN